MSSTLQVNPNTDGLIVVDVQNDFCPGGALAVPNGDCVVPVLNRWLKQTELFKIATRDWHPPEHSSFEQQGGPWPPHCVRDTHGARFHPDLAVDKIDEIVSKGTDPVEDSYSCLDSGELSGYLGEKEISRLWIGGLATEYCVGETVVDACERGFDVFVIKDGIKGIDVEPGDVEKACNDMKQAGAEFVRTREVL